MSLISRSSMVNIGNHIKYYRQISSQSVTQKVALMYFLRFPTLAQSFAKVSTTLISQGGVSAAVTRRLIAPLTQTFSVGDTVPKAIATATSFLTQGQQLLLDYVEEMVDTSALREAAFNEIVKLIDAMSSTEVKYIPLKITALIDYKLIEKKSQGIEFTSREQSEFNKELLRVFTLVSKAKRANKVVFIDQEYPHQKQAIFNIMIQLMEHFNCDRPTVYATIQASDRDCFALYKQVMSNSSIVHPAVKLVNGAYVNWAHQHGYASSMQPSKMASFTAFALLAKACLKEKKGPLYLGSHNPILISMVDKYAHKAGVFSPDFVKGQLYGFTTQSKPETLYVIFGSPTSCIDYALRRVVEGAGSNKASSSPILDLKDVELITKESGLKETLSEEEVQQLQAATGLNLQKIRHEVAYAEYKASSRT